MKRKIISVLEPIHPNIVYRANEAAKLVRVDRSVIYDAYKKAELPGKELGRGLKFLGSDLLKYAGTATNVPKQHDTYQNAAGAATKP